MKPNYRFIIDYKNGASETTAASPYKNFKKAKKAAKKIKKTVENVEKVRIQVQRITWQNCGDERVGITYNHLARSIDIDTCRDD